MKKAAVYLTIMALFASLAFMPMGKGDGHWELLKTKNKIAARSECSFVRTDEGFFLIGGDGPAMPVEDLDLVTLTWNKKAIAPVPMHHLQAVAYDYKIYVLGAFMTGNYPNQTPIDHVYRYDTQYNMWEVGGEIPASRRRAGGGTAEYKGKLYLVAGITNGHTSGTNAMFDEYDPIKKTWKQLPDAPHIRDHAQAVVVGDKLYALGGRNTSLHDKDNFMSFFDKVQLAVDCYDFKKGKWSTLAAELPLGTGGGTAVNLDGKIYYIGGERATATTPNGPQKDVFYYDPAKGGQWVKTADLNLARNGVGGTVYEHKIYIAGGAGGGMPGPSPGAGPGGPPQGPPPPKGDKAPQGPPPGGQGGGDIAVEVFTLK
ncbi:Kelch repeat-containing protein [Mucilaginibacter psychrotolerans]|uniref:Galactose oxidase n=1 Tax=Mucilaginibacter psychrotolerans TaxID=1524096 RepID=A0A4Y8S8B1_9SPHI|nr:kelch-like protein [Mucilaginibacter psychrotolerans]TFF35142.1 galactose oxidase [Mucilaginibacter psychrotolerans]